MSQNRFYLRTPLYRKIFVISSLICLCSYKAFSSFEFNLNCIKGYQNIIYFKFDQAQHYIDLEKKNNPKNSIILLLENYRDYLTILSEENPKDFEKLESFRTKRLDQISKDDKNSPYYLLCQGEICLQMAVAKLKFEEYVSGALELQKAFKFFEANSKRFPEFLPNQKSLGLLYVLIGAIPNQYKWALSAIGLYGDIKKGIHILESLKNNLPSTPYYYLYDESAIYLSFLQLTITNDPKVFEKTISYVAQMDKENLLASYIMAFVAFETHHSGYCIETLTKASAHPYFNRLKFLNYLMGLAKLQKGDADAPLFFDKYLNAYAGIYFIKDTYLKLAWYYLLANNRQKYSEYIIRCKKEGFNSSETDKEALKTANSPNIPNLILLKSKLRFDGGFYNEALDILSVKKVEDFAIHDDKIEFNYRMGRIYKELGKTDIAIQYLTGAITLGLKKPSYFSAHAALILGQIYESRSSREQAQYYYKLCLKLAEKDNRFQIKEKANNALNNLNKR